MHGRLSRKETLNQDTALKQVAPPNQDIAPNQAGKVEIVALLAFGGVLTLAWAAFLLWAVIELVIWVVS